MNNLFYIWIKIFFLLTPFFVLSMFLAITQNLDERSRRITAVKTTAAIAVICVILFFLGNHIFRLLGITLDAFQIGTGALLFLSAVKLVGDAPKPVECGNHGDITVVPLAIPITIGPATTGTLLVMGAENMVPFQRLTGCIAIIAAALSVGVLLYLAASVEKLVGKTGLSILSKVTGLILAAMSAQLIMGGVAGFFQI
jgi:multiple antibiotic resistance protein